LALVIMLVASEKAQAQFMGYGGGYFNPAFGFGYPAFGYGYPGLGYGYPFWGYASYSPYPYYNPGYTLPALGGGYPALGYGYAYPGTNLGMGYLGLYGSGFYNPLFGVGLTPLGTESYLYETQFLGRVPRAPARYPGPAPGPPGPLAR
jgi:hypothetical protein